METEENEEIMTIIESTATGEPTTPTAEFAEEYPEL